VGHAPDNLIKEEPSTGGAGKGLYGCFGGFQHCGALYRLAHLPVQPVLELHDSPFGIPLPVVL